MSTGIEDTPQRRALRHVTARSTGGPIDPRLRLTLNFHPDRTARGRPVLHGLAEDGLYRSQFVTGTGAGSLSAHPGGDRWRWESRMFGGAYDDAPGHERPVYGAVDFRGLPGGGAPRFGSSYLRLTADTVERATFCYPDSFTEPENFGVATRFALLAILERDNPPPLDDYVEAQVHGPVRLDRDVEALVLDPCYRGTQVEKDARRLPCPLEWHPGFRITVDVLRRRPDFRGPEFVALGEEIAEDGLLDARIIGDAERSGRYDPQDLKRVWHYVAHFGAPQTAAPAPTALASP
ncbi:DUF3626 domain-containing protein [Kitasatospora sp. KL5]|uniref:DUF3626 domain-containing protein n=1 Tax=Kitasatospora sp. KL5 TaxID=3425125 RepID=UPI003D6EA3DE